MNTNLQKFENDCTSSYKLEESPYFSDADNQIGQTTLRLDQGASKVGIL